MTLQREAPARHGRRTTAAAPTGARHLLSQLLHPAAWPPRRTATALGAGILAVTAAGVLTELGWHLPTLPSVFDLDAEQPQYTPGPDLPVLQGWPAQLLAAGALLPLGPAEIQRDDRLQAPGLRMTVTTAERTEFGWRIAGVRAGV